MEIRITLPTPDGDEIFNYTCNAESYICLRDLDVILNRHNTMTTYVDFCNHRKVEFAVPTIITLLPQIEQDFVNSTFTFQKCKH